MAELLNQYYSFEDLCYSQQHNFSPQQPTAAADRQTRSILHRQIDAIQGQSMSQPLLQRQLRPDGSIHPMQNMTPRSSEQYTRESERGASVTNMAPTQRTMWGLSMGIDEHFTATHGLPMEPYIMPESGFPIGPNSHLHYHGALVGQASSERKGYSYGEGSSWALPTTSILARQASVFHGSDTDTNTNATSTSPRSYFSELSEYDQILAADFAPLNRRWAGLESAPTSKLNTSSCNANMRGMGLQVAESATSGASADFAMQHNSALDIVPSVEHAHDGAMSTIMEPNESSWAGSFFVNDTSSNSWYPSDLTAQSTGLPYYTKGMSSTDSYPRSGVGDSPYAAHLCSDASYRSSREGSETNRHVPERDGFAGGRMADNHLQRKAEDRILLEGKAAGLTYKEIKKKLRTPVAESTLRGRYRSLTKERKDRVRKPVWTEQDIKLLKDIVRSELDRLDYGYRSSSHQQRLAKVSWKKVAEHIAEHGGSYLFGNSTCKKKWAEIEPGEA